MSEFVVIKGIDGLPRTKQSDRLHYSPGWALAGLGHKAVNIERAYAAELTPQEEIIRHVKENLSG